MTGRAILDADMATVGGWLADGARWWVGELTQLVPARWRHGARGRAPVAHFLPADGTIAGAAPGAAIVRVPRDYCLVRTIEQPALAPRDLARLLALSADRIMPFPGEAIIAGRVIGPAALPGRVLVEAAGLPHARADALAAAIVATRITPIAVEVEPAHDDGLAPIDLLPELRAHGILAARSGTTGGWWAVVLFLIALNAAMIVWRDAAAVDRLRQTVAEQQPALNAARTIGARIRRGQREAGAVLALRRAREPLAILGRVSAAMPDGAWLQRFTLDGDTVRLTGYRPASVDMVRALRTTGLRDVRPASGEEMAAVPTGQPFDITARIGQR